MTITPNEGLAFEPLPLDRAFIQAARRLVSDTIDREGLTSAALMLNGCGAEAARYLLLAEQEAPEGLNQAQEVHAQEFIVSSLQSTPLGDERFALPESISVPVNWNGQRLGYFVALMPAARRGLVPDLSALETDLARLIRRYRLRQKLLSLYGDQPFWIGASRTLCQLDDQLLRLATSELPVVITGEPGCGKRLAARAIHGYAFDEFRPFIEANCAEWTGRGALDDLLAELWSNARTGSLLLRNVDRLSESALSQLLEHWQAERERQLGDESLAPTRLLMSIGNLDALKRDEPGLLSEWLEFNALELRLPTLRERRADIRALGEFFAQEFRLGKGFDFAEDAWQQLEAYPWPGNVQQLKNMIQKLAVVADTSLVTSSLLARWFPSLGAPSRSGMSSSLAEAQSPHQEGLSLQSLFGGLRELKWEHPGLVRAMDYMLTYHRHPLTVELVSSAVKLPEVQLNQLLKYRLGMSFEQMMSKIRVEQAKVLIQQSPSELPAEIGQRVGFANAEVFEQTFKRLMGQTPQGYRSQFFKPLSLVRNN